MDNKSLLAQIKKSFFEIILSIIIGNHLGWMGLLISERYSVPRLFVLGGLGYAIYVPMFRIWVLLVFCIGTYIIIRFRLRGIIFVILYHYISILIVMLTTNFISNVQEEFHNNLYDPWYQLNIPLFVIFTAIPTLLYNAFLFYLLYYYIRQSLREKRLQNESNVNCYDEVPPTV